VELNSLDAVLTQCWKQINDLPAEDRERAIQFYAVYLAYLVRLYRKKELPIGQYTPN
jgi:hypothetical protein